MEQEDGLVASVRAMLEAELGKEPSPRAGSGAARRIDELRASAHPFPSFTHEAYNLIQL